MRSRLIPVLLITGILSGCSAPNGTRLSDAETHGQALFDFHCADCHEESHPELWRQPPRLDGVFRAKTLPSGAVASDEQVRRTILEGRGTMPAFDQRLREHDINDLLKYLHTLK